MNNKIDALAYIQTDEGGGKPLKTAVFETNKTITADG